jgi:hypothetical protein
VCVPFLFSLEAKVTDSVAISRQKETDRTRSNAGKVVAFKGQGRSYAATEASEAK